MAVHHDVSLPVQNPTKSYWQDPPHPNLSRYCSDQFPKQVDTIIIGSGITGALIAHDILARDHGQSGKSLLMLEARELASGATGRNGGHIKPDCYRGFLNYAELHGPDIAKQQCEFERANKEALVEFIKQENLQDLVDLVELRTADAYLTDAAWARGKASYDAFRAHGGNVNSIEILESREAAQKLRMKEVSGAITYPACSLWPYKLTTAIIERCIHRGLLVHTETPVHRISEGHNGQQWSISTSRGSVQCNQIFHATNGYAGHLIPELSSHLVPLKGIVAAIDPGPAYQRTPLDHTFGLHWGEDFDYMIQRPSDGKPMIMGGGDLHHPKGLFGHVGEIDDSTVTKEVLDALEESPNRLFQGWEDGSKLRCAWSGIMGLSSDELPFVGELPGKKGQYVAAGYHGHGMARALLTVKALCQTVYGETRDLRCPAVYFEIESRLNRKSAFEDIRKELESSRV